MNTDNFLIEENDIELAQNICKVIEDDDTRNRAVADSLASKIAERFFDKETCDVDTVSGLHNIGQVLEDIDIADIYINNSYIDVRLYFNDEELGVPKAHFDNNLLPVAYMFIKVSPDLSNVTFTGFIQPENIEQSNIKDDFIAVDETQLESFYDIEPLLVTKEDAFDISETDIFAYLENSIDDKYAFYKSLIASKDGRMRLAKVVKAQYAFNFISINNNQNEEQNSIEAFEPTEELLTDEFVSENLDSNDFMDIGVDNEILDLEPAQDNMLLEEADTLSNDFDNSLNSSLDIVDNIEPVQQDDLDIVDELNIDDNTENIQEEFSDINISNTTPESTSELTLSIDNQITEKDDNNDENVNNDNSFEFSTTTSPSLNSLSDNLDDLLNQDTEENKFDNTENEIAPEEEQSNSSENILDLFEKEDENAQEENRETTIIKENLNENNDESSSKENENNSEQIEALFNADNTDEVPSMEYQKPKQKSSIKLLAVIGLLVVLGAVGYLGYNQFANQTPQEDENNLITDSVQAPAPQQQEEAMPVESVETTTPKLDNNEGTAESIPAIEQNLDASILVSNLKVDWEVPAGYASNTSARRYLVKLGKIIQLNLKTELLLLNKPPITNKIAVEIKYNDSAKKFEAVGVTVSSGEQSVDKLIMQTVNKALAMNLSVNSDSFKNLQGNPVLIIHL